MDSQENAEKIILAKMKQLEKQAKVYEDKICGILVEISVIDKENKALKKDLDNEGNKSKIEVNNNKIKELRKLITDINKEKEEKLGCKIDLQFRDDMNIRPSVDI